jgi:hypothetical protein
VTKKTLSGMKGITSKYLSSPNGLEQKQKLLGKEGITEIKPSWPNGFDTKTELVGRGRNCLYKSILAQQAV